MPFIVATYIYASIQGQRTHSARTNIPIRESRESTVRFSCYRGFVLVGERLSHCMGESWSVGELPVCASESR